MISRRRRSDEPIVAFRPPGSNGDVNVSIIVSPLPRDFPNFEKGLGGAQEVGEAVLRKISRKRKKKKTMNEKQEEEEEEEFEVKTKLINASVREASKAFYYKPEFKVETPSFCRHSVAICTARGGKVFTLDAQSTESPWHSLRNDLYTVADSFNLL